MVIRDIDQQRLSRLEGAYEQVDCWLNDMNSRLDGMQQAIDGLRVEMNSRFNMLIVAIVASWATLITTLFLK